MTTTEADTGRSVYDGFISYSHAADGLLAPRLQSGLQRFAKPWWKRRALRVFRDESSLSANPHLWESVTQALDTSGWFVLLLSPDAAQSEWVNQEIAYWVEHKDPSRILPVVTAGEFGWADGDVTGDAVPDALRDVLASEPRWVDMRFARDEEQLDLQDPRFADAIADLASAMRGVPKDELAGEEVRQHRRTVRTAWAAGVLVLVLAVVAVGFGVQSARNADKAERLADDAVSARADAEDNAAEADRERAVAQENALLAEARELAASAIGVLDDDPELAMMLAVASLDRAPTGGLFPEGLISLRRAMDANVLVDRFDSGGTWMVVVPGADAVVFARSNGELASHAFEDGHLADEPSWVLPVAAEPETITFMDVAPDGLLVVAVHDPSAGPTSPFSLRLVDGASGTAAGNIPIPECFEQGDSAPVFFSPDGAVVSTHLQPTSCATERWEGVVFFEVPAGNELVRWEGAKAAHFTRDMAEVMLAEPSEVAEIRSWPSLELTHSVRIGEGSMWHFLLPDGETIVVRRENAIDLRPEFWDVESGTLRSKADSWNGFALGFGAVRDDGRVFLFGSDSDGLYDPRTGLKDVELPTATTWDARWSYDGRYLLTVSRSGLVEVWDVTATREALSVTVGPGEETPLFWLNPDTLVGGDEVGMLAFAQADHLWVLTLDPESGEPTAWTSTTSAGPVKLGDGYVVTPVAEDGTTKEPLSLWLPADGSVVPILDCAVDAEEFGGDEERFDAVGAICPSGDIYFGDHHVAASPDGSELAVVGWDPTSAVEDPGPRTDPVLGIFDVETGDLERRFELTLERGLGNQALGPWGDDWLVVLDGAAGWHPYVSYRVLDVESGEWVAELPPESSWRETRAINASRSRLYLVEESGVVWEYDTANWEPLRSWTAMEGRPRGMALSPDETHLAVSGEDEVVAIWDLRAERPVLADRIPVDGWPSDIVWVGPDRMGVGLLYGPNEVGWALVDLESVAVVAEARHRLIRPFTPDECETYRIDPCPTLEEMRNP